jgi:hypothetical protein
MELMVSSMLSQLDYENRKSAKDRNQHDQKQQDTAVTAAFRVVDPDAVIYNPVEYTCGTVFEEKIGWIRYLASTTNYVYTSTYGCKTVFCTQDGCNQRANGFTGNSWFYTYICIPFAYGLLGLLMLVPLALIVSCLCLCVTLFKPNSYTEIPNQAPLAVPSEASPQAQPC